MFSRARDASKVALVHLVARLRLGGFRLLDTQFVTAHLAQFGAIELPRNDYRALLAAAVDAPARWLAEPERALLRAEFLAIAGRQRQGSAAGCNVSAVAGVPGVGGPRAR
jgi:leucyl/phenylalanyl-tRNA--protein transferase